MAMFVFILQLVVFALLGYSKGVQGLRCYWCSGVGEDRECEFNPRRVTSGPGVQTCSTKYCIVSKVIKEGHVQSIARLCDDTPRGNLCVKDSRLTTCFHTCATDLCNHGNPDPAHLPMRPYSPEFLGLPSLALETLPPSHEHQASLDRSPSFSEPRSLRKSLKIRSDKAILTPRSLRKGLSLKMRTDKDILKRRKGRTHNRKRRLNKEKEPLRNQSKRLKKIFPNRGKPKSHRQKPRFTNEKAVLQRLDFASSEHGLRREFLKSFGESSVNKRLFRIDDQSLRTGHKMSDWDNARNKAGDSQPHKRRSNTASGHFNHYSHVNTKAFMPELLSVEHLPRESAEHIPRRSSEHIPRESAEYIPRRSAEYIPRKSAEYILGKSADYIPKPIPAKDIVEKAMKDLSNSLQRYRDEQEGKLVYYEKMHRSRGELVEPYMVNFLRDHVPYNAPDLATSFQKDTRQSRPSRKHVSSKVDKKVESRSRSRYRIEASVLLNDTRKENSPQDKHSRTHLDPSSKKDMSQSRLLRKQVSSKVSKKWENKSRSTTEASVLLNDTRKDEHSRTNHLRVDTSSKKDVSQGRPLGKQVSGKVNKKGESHTQASVLLNDTRKENLPRDARSRTKKPLHVDESSKKEKKHSIGLVSKTQFHSSANGTSAVVVTTTTFQKDHGKDNVPGTEQRRQLSREDGEDGDASLEASTMSNNNVQRENGPSQGFLDPTSGQEMKQITTPSRRRFPSEATEKEDDTIIHSVEPATNINDEGTSTKKGRGSDGPTVAFSKEQNVTRKEAAPRVHFDDPSVTFSKERKVTRQETTPPVHSESPETQTRIYYTSNAGYTQEGVLMVTMTTPFTQGEANSMKSPEATTNKQNSARTEHTIMTIYRSIDKTTSRESKTESTTSQSRTRNKLGSTIARRNIVPTTGSFKASSEKQDSGIIESPKSTLAFPFTESASKRFVEPEGKASATPNRAVTTGVVKDNHSPENASNVSKIRLAETPNHTVIIGVVKDNHSTENTSNVSKIRPGANDNFSETTSEGRKANDSQSHRPRSFGRQNDKFEPTIYLPQTHPVFSPRRNSAASLPITISAPLGLLSYSLTMLAIFLSNRLLIR